MKSLVKWAVRNGPAMNTAMVAILAVGLLSVTMLRREVFPAFDLEIVLIQVPYPGASAEECERGICLKVEEAIRSIEGIKKITAIATEGSGNIIAELEADVGNVQKVLGEIRSEVDRIPSFPELAEDPTVKQLTITKPAITVGVLGPKSDDPRAAVQLRNLTEEIRDEMLNLPSVTQLSLVNAPEFQIDIEISESSLRKYGLSLRDVAKIIREENLEMPGGNIKSESTEFLVRGKNKALVGPEIAKLPVITRDDGVVLRVQDIGTVRDEFIDNGAESQVDGQPALALRVKTTSNEDLLKIVEEVRKFVNEREMPHGYKLLVWGDDSQMVRDRLNMLGRNGIQGLILVFIVLATFLEIRLAFWVSLGIPISVLGACAIMLGTGETMNMLTMFAFIMTLGIVVDDAIVVGENVYAHRQQGKPPVKAAIDGTVEVMPSVISSVLTTIFAFAPMMFVSGVMGKFIAVMPMVVIATLLISLFESTFILPVHLAHSKPSAKTKNRFRQIVDQSLDWFIQKIYLRVLRFVLIRPAIMFATAIGSMMLTIGLFLGGFTPWDVFPEMNVNLVQAGMEFPAGTSASVSREALNRIEKSILDIDQQYFEQHGIRLVDHVYSSVGMRLPEGGGLMESRTGGGHVGIVEVELTNPETRPIHSKDILAMWRAKTGIIPGVESVKFQPRDMGPAGKDIEFKLLSDNVDQLSAAAKKTKDRLASYAGVVDISDDASLGKIELQLRKRPEAEAMGVSLQDLANTIRASYRGEEVMRLQRGRHEVKLMVRYPPSERQSLADFNEIRVRTPSNGEVPLPELAHVVVTRDYAEINRVDQTRSVTISASIDPAADATSAQVTEDLKAYFTELFQEYPEVRVRWEGEAERTSESLTSLAVGFILALFAMYGLLTLNFRSYLQPLIILAVIPFGIVGAVFGHFLMGMPFTMFSVFGLVALSGVVANDSIVLVDFINHRLSEGLPIGQALIEAGQQRFRPVLLTSLTTVAGLVPILTEKSMQAQVLIPMALSLSSGLALATVWVLVLVPVLYQTYHSMITRLGHHHHDVDYDAEHAEPTTPSENTPTEDPDTSSPVSPDPLPSYANVKNEPKRH